ncbi:unnamed protein product [Danaus chrysippus]|uniref:(African queen) hypothetical protein n=1 Tax=Danaus chrysippus TaxID=151541 RepID=A0A8J2QHJ5_9NEOP|nr:unnamed protein product [Danaus chrysippus]
MMLDVVRETVEGVAGSRTEEEEGEGGLALGMALSVVFQCRYRIGLWERDGFVAAVTFSAKRCDVSRVRSAQGELSCYPPYWRWAFCLRYGTKHSSMVLMGVCGECNITL